ncbi:uncharacterized protein [Procambarus clarkii]|uniref:uncharacterized protein n=1 Tax=Procambarus clarkii TaxID=6728 RepID=UPI001E672379|nr:uncharacterized protein LOC123759626 [Procambarus clarkii]XP_045600719.1 uncharacterized protein LOC123759626 [Procambarus clarkii]XP_045600720.1 uncharacterized protein LOC123759626 [Procambarus clarkii]XP_045600721.1 uncharacterized protein LOC123759626 [Procambarus clarkii]XP_045600722.1 uncharacterized protein LOC123759626 [Procambarus clarkii]
MWYKGSAPIEAARIHVSSIVYKLWSDKLKLSFCLTDTMKQFQRIMALLFVAAVIYLMYQLNLKRYLWRKQWKNPHPLIEEYSVWPLFSSKIKRSQQWYTVECFGGNFSDDLEEIFGSLISAWSESENAECADIYQKFLTLYEVHDRYSGKISLPAPFAKRVSEWMKGDKTLLKNIHHQHLIHVFHPLTSEHVVYNPIRAKRPLSESKMSIFEWVDKTSTETAKDCDFCKYNNMTAVDEFGRHTSKDTVRMTNTFKVEAWHSMVITRHLHHPTNLSRDLLVKFFQEATTWLNDVSKKDVHYIYPNLAWDTLFHAGASQIHPHVHMMLAPDHYYGFMELLRLASQRYFLAKGENYFSAVLDVHAALGLVVEYGDAAAIATLTGKADLEVMFLSDYPGDDFYRLIYYTVQAYHDTFQQLCKSLGGAWPALGTSEQASKGRIPAVARLVSRGHCSSLRADYSSLEIFQVVYRPHDPWQVAAAIRKAIEKYG